VIKYPLIKVKKSTKRLINGIFLVSIQRYGEFEELDIGRM